MEPRLNLVTLGVADLERAIRFYEDAAPDLSALGYLAGPRVGAYTYNLAHHKGVAGLLYVLGAQLAGPIQQLAGAILLAHSSLDRAFGYGLKHTASFQHMHRGWSGRARGAEGG